MAQILVRNLDEKVVERPKKRAAEAGRSLQVEVKQVLETSALMSSPMMNMEEARAFSERLQRQSTEPLP